jgi:hypothetical protein
MASTNDVSITIHCDQQQEHPKLLKILETEEEDFSDDCEYSDNGL